MFWRNMLPLSLSVKKTQKNVPIKIKRRIPSKCQEPASLLLSLAAHKNWIKISAANTSNLANKMPPKINYLEDETVIQSF